ncbi:MAG: toll/interleukin-1 receptor domain-containing protein [Cyanobacteria bacterium P01_B01_bin.77]
MRVFISWSGLLSRNIAKALTDWLPFVIQSVDPFFSPEDIAKGDRWSSEIAASLEKCTLGIFCVTPDNFGNPWLLFEAGAISNQVGSSRIIPILFGDIRTTDITGPLTQFQCATFQRDEIYKVVKTLNNSPSEKGINPLKSEVLDKAFEMFWPGLENTINKTLSEHKAEFCDIAPQRSEPELLHEILEIVRHFKDEIFAQGIQNQYDEIIQEDAIRVAPQLANLLLKSEQEIPDLPMYMEATGSFYNRTFILHQFIHKARDMCLTMFPTASIYASSEACEQGIPLPNSYLEKNRLQIVTLLEYLAKLFQQIAPSGTKVWTCLRDRRSDDCYHTFERAGVYNAYRDNSSKPLPKDSIVLVRLRDTYKNGCCVLLTGSGCGPQIWQAQENDRFGEDKTVMLGSVLTKSWDQDTQDWSNNKFAWILGVSADTENAFSEVHIHLMQTCVVIFSLLANIIVRYEDG